MKKTTVLRDLLFTFMKVGLFTFGGGYAMLSVIENACVEEKQWITHDEMMNITVIAESTPGPIAINCATYVGYKMAGFVGAVVATLGIVLPSFAVIYIIAQFLDNFLDIAPVAAAMKGVKIGVSIVILQAGFTMLRKMPKRLQPRCFAAFGFIAMLLINLFTLSISSIALMLLAGAVSVALFIAKGAPEQKGGAKK